MEESWDTGRTGIVRKARTAVLMQDNRIGTVTRLRVNQYADKEM